MECHIITMQDAEGRSHLTRVFYNDVILYTRSFCTHAEAEIESEKALEAAVTAGWIRVSDA